MPAFRAEVFFAADFLAGAAFFADFFLWLDLAPPDFGLDDFAAAFFAGAFAFAGLEPEAFFAGAFAAFAPLEVAAGFPADELLDDDVPDVFFADGGALGGSSIAPWPRAAIAS